MCRWCQPRSEALKINPSGLPMLYWYGPNRCVQVLRGEDDDGGDDNRGGDDVRQGGAQ